MKAVVLLSGGMDSTVLLAHAISNGFDVHAMSVDYGQRHDRELQSALDVAEHYNVPYTPLDMSLVAEYIFAGAKSSQVGVREDVPHGHYAADTMKTTIVPNRNMLLLALAGAKAAAVEAGMVAYAAHAGDHAIYPDCRPEFANAISDALNVGNDPSIVLWRPFIEMSKTDICLLGSKLGVPFNLTWSCYDPQFILGVGANTYIHCGKCGTCVERKEAFIDATVADPTEYADGEPSA